MRSQWRIEAGELHRVYAPSASNGTHSNKTRDRATATLIEAQHRADLAEQRLSDLKNTLDDDGATRRVATASTSHAAAARRRNGAAAVVAVVARGLKNTPRL
jgi:uncharacterized membrane protein